MISSWWTVHRPPFEIALFDAHLDPEPDGRIFECFDDLLRFHGTPDWMEQAPCDTLGHVERAFHGTPGCWNRSLVMTPECVERIPFAMAHQFRPSDTTCCEPE